MDLETIQILLDLLNPLHGSLDYQTYDDEVKQNFDVPVDSKYDVRVTAGMLRGLTQAVLILEDRKRQAKRGAMRFSSRVEEYRLRSGFYASAGGAPYGAFEMPGPCSARLTIMADDGEQAGWEHVSVSTERRMPNWIEMSFVKDLFWAPEECVVQFHPPASMYVNNHARCLHLWRYTRGEFPMPPAILVGIKEEGVLA